MDGLELLQRLRGIDGALPVIVLTGHGSIATAIEAIQRGAFHYLTKPCDIPELEIYLHKAIDQRNVRRENEQLRGLIQRARDTHGIVGGSPAIRNLLNLIERMKDADAPVLVTGESGTGKELVAQALHYQGKRREHPFIAINCATLKPELLENELFGHVSGAFTGAVNRKEGLLAAAGPGTLFIDEIADMDPNVQASLLRVIETGEYRPLGSTKLYKTTVRIVAAANRDLAREVAAQRFRQDLYYRLSVLVIPTPPLRDNPETSPSWSKPTSTARTPGGRDSNSPPARSGPCGLIPGPATCGNFSTSANAPCCCPTTRSSPAIPFRRCSRPESRSRPRGRLPRRRRPSPPWSPTAPNPSRKWNGNTSAGFWNRWGTTSRRRRTSCKSTAAPCSAKWSSTACGGRERPARPVQLQRSR